MSRPQSLALTVILAVALLLRVHGLGWGVPNALHLASYHPDEWQTVESALRTALSGDPNPHFFNYPSLTIDLAAVWLKLSTVLVSTTEANLGLFYILARLLTVAAGVLGVWFTFRLGERLGGVRLGLLAAAALAVLPLHVVNSHFATVDVPLTTWATLVLWAATALCDRELDSPSAWRWTLLGAVACGLATGTKYNGALLLAPLAIGIGLGGHGLRRTLAAAGVTVVVFALTSPFVLLDPTAPGQIRFELLEHPRSSNLFGGVGPAWWFQLSHNLPTAAGWLLPVTAVAGLGVWLARRQRAAVPLVLWLVLTALTLTRTHEMFIRYLLPLLPPLAVAAAAALEAVGTRRAVCITLTCLVLAPAALRSRAYAALLAGDDARDRAAQWCFAHVPAGASVGELEPTWFWSVPLRPNNGGARTGSGKSPCRYLLHSDPDAWPSQPPDWLVINDTKRLERYASQPDRWAELTRGYDRVQVFENRAAVLPGVVQTGRGSRQHDWLYALPVIEVWRRR